MVDLQRAESSYKFLVYAAFFSVIALFVILIILSIYVRDYDLIKDSPLLFVIETFVIAVGASIPFTYFCVRRGISSAATSEIIIALMFKFALLHVLLELSGFYRGSTSM